MTVTFILIILILVLVIVFMGVLMAYKTQAKKYADQKNSDLEKQLEALQNEVKTYEEYKKSTKELLDEVCNNGSGSINFNASLELLQKLHNDGAARKP